jgi:signal transduction histidine kinase
MRGDAARARIDRLLTANLAIVAAVISGVLAVQIGAVSSPWILLIVTMTATYGATLLWARSQNRRGRLGRAVIVMNLAVWPLAIGATIVVPQALPITCLSGLGPVLLAVPELSRRAVARVLATSVALTAVIMAFGTRTDVTGLGERLSPWILDLAIILAIPALVGLVLIIGFQNHQLLTDRTEALTRSRADITDAADRERRRIERDLHDGAQQRLHGALVQMSVASRLLRQDSTQSKSFIQGARNELVAAVSELHDLVQGVEPAGLRELGLVDALRDVLVRRTPRGQLLVRGVGQLTPAVGSAVWFCCLEAIANADKHAGLGCRVIVELDGRHGGLEMRIIDDGPGFDALTTGASTGGLRNMEDRLRAVGGALWVRSSPAGTVVTGRIPDATDTAGSTA